MKLVTGMVASLVIGTLSFGAFAAKEIQKEDVAKMNLDQGRQHHDLQDDVTDGRPTRSV
ncbi:exported protein [Klebsiella aerogenes]|nr:exported protein [Klebsiella aerogenes]